MSLTFNLDSDILLNHCRDLYIVWVKTSWDLQFNLQKAEKDIQQSKSSNHSCNRVYKHQIVSGGLLHTNINCVDADKKMTELSH